MKKLFTVLTFLLAIGIHAGHHEKGEMAESTHSNNFVYMSTYTQPAGGNPEILKKSLLKNIDDLEKNGYNRCGMLRHQFGGDRSFLTYCYFDDWEQFAEINDNAEPLSGGSRQLFGDHTDNIAAVLVRNATVQMPYVLEAKYIFGPYLTDNQKRANARILFDAYDRAFGGCNMAEHVWGPELSWNFYCGYESYADFAKKVTILSKIHEEELADKKLDVKDHSDHMMQRVYR